MMGKNFENSRKLISSSSSTDGVGWIVREFYRWPVGMKLKPLYGIDSILEVRYRRRTYLLQSNSPNFLFEIMKYRRKRYQSLGYELSLVYMPTEHGARHLMILSTPHATLSANVSPELFDELA